MDLSPTAVCLWWLTLMVTIKLASPSGILNFRDLNQPVAAEVGERYVKLVCQQNTIQGSDYTNVTFEHQNPVTSEKRVLGKLVDVTPYQVAPGYDLSATEKGGLKTIALSIDTIDLRDDGNFICTVLSGDDEKSVNKNLIVIKKLQVLSLQFQKETPVSEKPAEPVEIEPGTHTVRCIAEGSNPPTTEVRLLLDDRVMSMEAKPEVSLMEGGERRYRTTALGLVEIPEDRSVHQLQCLARDTSGTQLSTKMDVSVEIPEVEDVQCQTEAGQGQRPSMSLVCTVDHAKMDVFNFAFLVGKTGQVIRAGEPGNETVLTTQPLSTGRTQVTLTVDRPEDWHFESDLYLLINTTQRHVHKEAFRLRKSEPSNISDRSNNRTSNSDGESSGPGDRAVSCHSSIAWISYFLVALLLWHRQTII